MDIKVSVFDEDQNDGDWPPENAAGFLSWFTEKINLIPVEFREKAKIEIDGDGDGDGCSYASILIYYYRPKTEQEKERYRQDEISRTKSVRQRELQQLAKLKAKYGE